MMHELANWAFQVNSRPTKYLEMFLESNGSVENDRFVDSVKVIGCGPLEGGNTTVYSLVQKLHVPETITVTSS